MTQEILDDMELRGMTEEDIAWHFEISRMGLYKKRKRMGWPQRSRSDKGRNK